MDEIEFEKSRRSSISKAVSGFNQNDVLSECDLSSIPEWQVKIPDPPEQKTTEIQLVSEDKV